MAGMFVRTLLPVFLEDFLTDFLDRFVFAFAFAIAIYPWETKKNSRVQFRMADYGPMTSSRHLKS